MQDELSNLCERGWPMPVAVSEPVGPLVKLSGIPSKYKMIAWREIQQRSPALADLLKEPMIQAIINQFEAELFVGAEFAPSLPVHSVIGRRPTNS